MTVIARPGNFGLDSIAEDTNVAQRRLSIRSFGTTINHLSIRNRRKNGRIITRLSFVADDDCDNIRYISMNPGLSANNKFYKARIVMRCRQGLEELIEELFFHM